MSKKQSNPERFKSGDVVLTKEAEKDIELIPARTAIKLTYKAVGGWHGLGKVDGLVRVLEVDENNLEHAFK